MQKTKQSGGLALPNFQYYYWAANIRNMLYWLRTTTVETPAWLRIESAHCGKSSLPALLGLALPLELYVYKHNPLIYHSLRIWVQCRKRFGLHSISIQSPVCSNHMFPPSLIDSVFKIWNSNGIHSLKDLYVNEIFASFTQLTQKFNILPTHFFRYLQIRNFMHSRYPQFPNLPAETTLDKILDINVGNKGVIRVLYNIFLSMHSPSLSIIRSQWEDDLASEITDQTWQSILHRVHSSSICAKHGLLQFKVLHRLHLSKEKLAKIYPGVDPMCSRCKIAIGSLIHSFWTCPNLHNYWMSVFNTFSEVFGVDLTPCPLIALFGVVPEGINLSRHYSDAIAFASLIARRLILMKWKQEASPTHVQWAVELMKFIHMGKIRCTIGSSTGRFYRTWQPFLSYMKTLKMCTLP